MDKNNAKNRIEELRKQTEYYAKKYYDDDNPEISDFEYDMLMLELRNLEKEYPEFIVKESLTQKVGGKVKEGFGKVQHEIPLLSMQDIFNIEEIKEYVEKIKKQAVENNIENQNFVVEIDKPFMASYTTISGYFSKELGIWTMQIEINSGITNDPKNIEKFNLLASTLIDWINNDIVT